MAGYQVLNMANNTDFDGALNRHLAGGSRPDTADDNAQAA